MEISNAEIEQLRNSFLSELTAKGENTIHPKDLQRVKTNDFWLKRFLMHNDKDQSKSLQMMWTSVLWRNEFKTNDITEANIKMDVLLKGGLFIHGKDIDGCPLLVFKCKLHTKGAADIDDLKRVVIYWFERLERLTNGKPISIFFDMANCGLGNMDMEFTKYIISLFKDYYPFFLNYIIIFEMPWVLSAAFKIIKSWLPEKAVEKIKFLKSKEIATYVPIEDALECWGGQNTYTFNFVPDSVMEKSERKNDVMVNNAGKKVHFVDADSMSDNSNPSEKDYGAGPLKVRPVGIIKFVREGNELISTVKVQNSDATNCQSFKMKTTSPEKFRVRPSTGALAPGASATISIILLEGFQLGGLSRDKFLVLSTPVDSSTLSPQELIELWKDTSGKKVFEVRLRCVQNGEGIRNGSVGGGSGGAGASNHEQGDQSLLIKLAASVAQLNTTQVELQRAVKRTQYYQIVTMVLFLLLGIVFGYVMRMDMSEIFNHSSAFCKNPHTP